MKKLLTLLLIVGILLMPWHQGVLAQEESTGEEVGEGVGTAAGIAICVATGVAAAAAPICGIIGGLIGKWIGGLFGGGADIEELYQNKEYKEDPKERQKAADLLRQMQSNILTVMRTGGPNGKPTWVTNWRLFVRDHEKKAREIFKTQIYDAALGENATICAYLADDIANTYRAVENDITFDGRSNEFMQIHAEQPFNIRARCTLPADYDHEKYLSGEQFSWDIFLKKLEPQNNSLGLWYLAESERQLQVQAQTETEREHALANGGNLGVNVEGIVTPGSVLNQVGAAAITSNLDWLISSDELGEVIFDANSRVEAQLRNLKNPGPLEDGDVITEREPASGMSRFLIELIASAVGNKITFEQLKELQAKVDQIEENTQSSTSPAPPGTP